MTFILSEADLHRARAVDPFMPKSRQLLAVPFVGKDVPSQASEFAHPDIVIGSSVLAYMFTLFTLHLVCHVGTVMMACGNHSWPNF